MEFDFVFEIGRKTIRTHSQGKQKQRAKLNITEKLLGSYHKTLSPIITEKRREGFCILDSVLW